MDFCIWYDAILKSYLVQAPIFPTREFNEPRRSEIPGTRQSDRK